MALDRELKESGREERGVCLLLCLCVRVYVCGAEQGRESKEGKTVGGPVDGTEKSKG